MTNETIINLDDPTTKETLIARIRMLSGIFRLKLVKHRERRTLSQNRYYFGVVLVDVAEGLREAWGESLTVEETHEFCKDRFLKKPVVDHNTGVIMGYTVPTTPKFDTKEFSDYLEQIFQFAAESLGVMVRPASHYAARVAAESRRGSARAVVHQEAA